MALLKHCPPWFFFPHSFISCVSVIIYFVPDNSGDGGPAASTTEPVQELSGYSPGSKPDCYSLGWRCQRCHCYQCFAVAFCAISECNLNLQEDKALVVFAKCIAQSPGPYYSHSWWDTISTPGPSAAQDGGLELSVFLEYSWDVGNKPHWSSSKIRTGEMTQQ